MEQKEVESVTIDAREIQPMDRHRRIFEEFLALKPGQELHVLVDHDPEHLVAHMKHEKLPLDDSAYRSYRQEDGTFVGVFRRSPDNVDDDNIKVTSIDRERSYLKDKFNPVAIYASDNYKVIITYIKAGQFIPVHSPTTDLIFAVFKGTGSAFAGEKEVPLLPGSVIIVPGGEKRGIKAKTDMEALHVVSPVPDENDHMEVMRKLLENSYL